MYFKTTLGRLSAGSAALCLSAGIAAADQVFADDLIVQGSICAGTDCSNGESFGFDTIRLKENNLRIGFDDTSVSASFPSNDWEITVNDSANGGNSFFAVTDSTAGRVPFKLMAGAPANAMLLDSEGDLGLGTSNPLMQLHVADGNTPTLRLEQNGSSGFSAQTWDIAGNETNFFVRDVTNSSKLPFRIEPGANDSSIYIDSTSNIGLGTNNPSAALEVYRNTGDWTTMLSLNNAGSGGIGYRMSSNGLNIDTNNTSGVYRINFDDGDNQELELNTDGDLTLDGDLNTGGNITITGTLTTSGSCSVGCDRVFDESYDLPSINKHAEMMFANKYLPNVGPTAEEGPYDISNKVLGMLNELEQAHIYISQLNSRIEELEARSN